MFREFIFRGKCFFPNSKFSSTVLLIFLTNVGTQEVLCCANFVVILIYSLLYLLSMLEKLLFQCTLRKQIAC